MQSVAKSSKNQSCYLKLSGRGGKGGENWRGREGVREVGHAGMLRLFSATPRAAAPRLLCPWVSPGKSTGVGCHVLLQGIFLTQELNLRLPPSQAGRSDKREVGREGKKAAASRENLDCLTRRQKIPIPGTVYLYSSQWDTTVLSCSFKIRLHQRGLHQHGQRAQ